MKAAGKLAIKLISVVYIKIFVITIILKMAQKSVKKGILFNS
ncbi:hypothetical protein Nizo1839_1632 [Lactiplantibacillus plantarum]|nr:hypothetical protein SF2A35B_1575 [Lactiplantibacillus plantarum]KZT80610.1 hypothetical protein Nizo1839_1632 [Lactiplantibacillus plantarum]KZU12490.1 hypothetical protein Nizo2264_2284 [Lactiplantibacillus plantarum]